jgi:hypothetical protein
MMILYSSGFGERFGPLWRAQSFALEHLISFQCASGDLRWAVMALISRSLTAAMEALFRNIGGRAWQGARFAGALTTADTMVAAGGG